MHIFLFIIIIFIIFIVSELYLELIFYILYECKIIISILYSHNISDIFQSPKFIS